MFNIFKSKPIQQKVIPASASSDAGAVVVVAPKPIDRGTPAEQVIARMVQNKFDNEYAIKVKLTQILTRYIPIEFFEHIEFKSLDAMEPEIILRLPRCRAIQIQNIRRNAAIINDFVIFRPEGRFAVSFNRRTKAQIEIIEYAVSGQIFDSFYNEHKHMSLNEAVCKARDRYGKK